MQLQGGALARPGLAPSAIFLNISLAAPSCPPLGYSPGTIAERLLDKFSRFPICGKGLKRFLLGIFWGFWWYFQILWRFLRRLRSSSFQKTPWGPILGQIKIHNKKIEKLSNKRSVLSSYPPPPRPPGNDRRREDYLVIKDSGRHSLGIPRPN